MKDFVLIQENSFNVAREKIRDKKDKKIIFSSNDDELNRKILEKEKIDILLLNQFGKKDFQKQRNSGFNQVLAKIAQKNKVIIGINFDEIVDSKGKQKIEILARVRQNIKLCNKNKLKMRFILQKYKRDIYDLKSLGKILGMPSWMLREVL